MSIFDEDYWQLFSTPGCETQIKRKKQEKEGEECQHSEVEDSICMLCGCEIQELDFKPEWSFYGVFDNKFSKDPSRCSMNKKTNNNLDNIFAKYKLDGMFSEKIKRMVCERYNQVTKNNTHRKKKKESIAAACLLYVLKEEGEIRTSEDIRLLLDIDKRDMSKGRQKYCEAIEKTRVSKVIKPSELISKTTKKIELDKRHNRKIIDLTKLLENTNSQLIRSGPPSVAAAVVYFYLSSNRRLKERYCNKDFFEKVKVSEVTVTKLIKSINEVVTRETD
jgi:transcription initiation factor TFIIIB Brf1 subunit/transcription initiation factor TFIIB